MDSLPPTEKAINGKQSEIGGFIVCLARIGWESSLEVIRAAAARTSSLYEEYHRLGKRGLSLIFRRVFEDFTTNIPEKRVVAKPTLFTTLYFSRMNLYVYNFLVENCLLDRITELFSIIGGKGHSHISEECCLVVSYVINLYVDL